MGWVHGRSAKGPRPSGSGRKSKVEYTIKKVEVKIPRYAKGPHRYKLGESRRTEYRVARNGKQVRAFPLLRDAKAWVATLSAPRPKVAKPGKGVIG